MTSNIHSFVIHVKCQNRTIRGFAAKENYLVKSSQDNLPTYQGRDRHARAPLGPISFIFMQFSVKILSNKKACVPSAAVAVGVGGCMLPGGVVCFLGGVLLGGVSASASGGVVCPGGVCPGKGCFSACTGQIPPVNRMTDRQV